MIEAEEGTRYVGITGWPSRRLREHREGDKASKGLSKNPASFRFVWKKELPSRWLALELEALVHTYNFYGLTSGCGRCGDDTGQCNCWNEDM
jgi:predicted GIY-YIG superfamily endonuclease